MVRISRGLVLIIISVILYFPGSIVFQMVLPFPLGLGFAFLIPAVFFIAGIILVIVDRNSPNGEKEIVYHPPRFCGKCGEKISDQDSFCINCGKEFKNST